MKRLEFGDYLDQRLSWRLQVVGALKGYACLVNLQIDGA